MIKMIVDRVGAALTLFALVAATAAAAVTLEVRAGYFFPSSADFREVYKNGLSFGADVTVPVWKSLHAWAGFNSFHKNGELTFTHEPTTLRIQPLFAGLKLQPLSGSLRPYAAGAAGFFLFKESNVLGTSSGQEFGLLAQLGLLVRIKGRLSVDIHGRFTSCRHLVGGPEPFTAQFGGLEAGLGLAFRL